MIKKTAKKIHELRIFFLIVIIAGFFVTLGMNPVDVTMFFGAKLGSAVGMSVGVGENPVNKIAKQLKDKETELNQKEYDLLIREKSLADNTIARQRMLIIVMAVGIIILFILVTLNYYLDYRRRKDKAI